jgi:hypothetical protein
MTLGRHCGLVAAAFLPLSAPAVADPSPPAPLQPTPIPPALLKLEPAKPVELTCRSKSVVVSANAANASNGTLKLTLVLKDTTAKPATGAWRIASVDSAHTGSLGQREGKTCAEACPLTLAADGNVELWSPAPKAIDKLAEGELLLLAVVKAATLDLRATTFSGKQIESLEEGTCRIGS